LMQEDDFLCKKCGNRMKLFFIKGFISILGVALLVIGAVVLLLPTELPGWIGYSLIIASGMTVFFTLRISCLSCEPAAGECNR
jgi:hypothetical protein